MVRGSEAPTVGPQAIGCGRQYRRLPRVFVLRQGEIVMHEADAPLERELFLDAFDRLLVQRLTRRAFEVAEEVDAHGRGYRAD